MSRNKARILLAVPVALEEPFCHVSFLKIECQLELFSLTKIKSMPVNLWDGV